MPRQAEAEPAMQALAVKIEADDNESDEPPPSAPSTPKQNRRRHRSRTPDGEKPPIHQEAEGKHSEAEPQARKTTGAQKEAHIDQEAEGGEQSEAR